MTRFFATVIGLILALPATAQQMSDADLLTLFETQRDAFRAASQGVKTRGLTLVTVDSVEATSLAPLQPQPGSADSMAPLPGQDGRVTIAGSPDLPVQPLVDQLSRIDTLPGTPDPQPIPVVFGALAPELQVNVDVRFPFDSASLTPDQTPVLTQMCSVMKASDIALFRIVGHTDASGDDAYNQRLSQLRAEEVQRYLVGDCGIAPSRLQALGLGETFLRDAADPKAAANRRVEFQALS